MAVVAAETIAGAETLTLGDYRMMPRATFCQPRWPASDSPREQARDEGYDVTVAKFPFSASGKAHGLADPPDSSNSSPTKYGELLGGHLIGPPTSPNSCPADAGAEMGPDGQQIGPQRPHPPDTVRRFRNASTGWRPRINFGTHTRRRHRQRSSATFCG